MTRLSNDCITHSSLCHLVVKIIYMPSTPGDVDLQSLLPPNIEYASYVQKRSLNPFTSKFILSSNLSDKYFSQ